MILENFEFSPYRGEMMAYERYKLYNWILELNPKVVFEVGTGDGGGSTYFIAKALKELNNGGIIYTCDPVRTINEKILNDFNNIVFFKKNSDDMITSLLNENIIPDFIMFDGPEIPEIAYNDIKILENYILDNTYFSMHDWDVYRPFDKAKSVKSIKIREYFEKTDKWELIEQLHADRKNSNLDNSEFDSVGLCLYKYKK